MRRALALLWPLVSLALLTGCSRSDGRTELVIQRFFGACQADYGRLADPSKAEPAKPVAPHGDITVIFDVVGAVKRGAADALAGEALLADLQRALEQPADLYLRDADLGRNLLSRELTLVSIETLDDHPSLELVGVGVACTWPHSYGDPCHVA